MKKPLIGISCNYDWKDDVGTVSQMGIDGQDWHFVAGDYIYAIEEAGGIPVVLPRLQNTEGYAAMLERLDGILISGGHDVDPSDYGERILGCCGRILPRRDAMDMELVNLAYAGKMPVLGICRGLQIMNAALGGTLYQDLESQGGYLHHFMGTSPRQYAVHRNSVVPGSLLHRILQTEIIEVNSYHHQGIRTVCPCGTVSAVSGDGVAEAVEFSGGNAFSLGVQWHPEMMFTDSTQKKIFAAFIRACGAEEK